MHIVVVSGMSGSVEALAKTLASALGKTAYEMRARASTPHGGPTVVATYGAFEPADLVAKTLRLAGLTVRVDTASGMVGRWNYVVGRQVELGEGFVVEDRAGERHEVVAASVDLLLASVGRWAETHTEVQKGRKFSAGRAALSGGLLLTRKTTTKSETTTQGGDRLLAVYAGDTCYLLYETELQYGGLGDLRQPTRMANFAVVQRELRARCEGAIYEDRLLTRAGQLRVLGPAFTPEEYGDLAAALVAATLLDSPG